MSPYEESISWMSIVGGLIAIICGFTFETYPIPAIIGMLIACALVIADRISFAIQETEHEERMAKIRRRLKEINSQIV